MTFFGQRDYYLDVANSDVADRNLVHKFGTNLDIDTGGFEDIWEGGGAWTGLDATAAETVEIFSANAADFASGTGARTVQIYGLAADYSEQNETVTLDVADGTNAVDSANTYIRVFRAVVRTVGSGGANAGIITIRQKTTTANIFVQMIAGYNQTMIACYTVPLGKAAYILSWTAGLSGKTNADVTARLVARPLDQPRQVKEEHSLMAVGTSHFHHAYVSPNGPYVAKTDILIAADTDTNDTAVSGSFELVLDG